MKRLLTGCLLALSLTGWGQLQFALEDPNVSFPPTTIDSTSTLSFVIINELSLPQEVSLTGLDAPFFPESDLIVVPGNDTLSVEVSFVPLDVTTYSDTVLIAGSVFGSDSLIVSGEGTLPEVTLVQSVVDFETVSINSIHTREFHIVNSGVGTLVIGDIASSIPEFSSSGFVEIPEGDTASLQVDFYTELADTYEGSLTIHTSDPFAPTVSIDLIAVAISEVGGTLCGNLTLINSPYVFVGDVTVPEECTLTIEPSVVVDLNGYVLNVQGTLEANGTPSDRITIENGQVQLTQEQFNTSCVDYSNNASLNVVNREIVYFNDFEDGNQPFYCYSDYWGGNTSGNGAYGCDYFDNVQDLTWSSNGLRSLRFYSNYSQGRLELDSDVEDLSSGLYQWSFLYKQTESRRDVNLVAYYRIDGGSWIEFYRSATDNYCDPSEQFSAFSEFIEVSAGSSIGLRFVHTNSGSDCNYRARTFLDDLRLDKVTQLPTEAYVFQNQATLGGSSTSASSGVAISGASFAYGAVGTSLQLQTGIGQAVAYWISRPLSIHSDRLFIDYFEQVTTADQNCWFYTEYRVNEGDWQLLREDHSQYCGDGSIGTHGWEQRKYVLENLNFGDQVEFQLRIEAYDIGNPIYRDVTVYVDEFRVREDFSQPVALRTTGTEEIAFSHATVSGDCLVIGEDVSFAVDSSSLEGIYIEGSHAHLGSSFSDLHKIDMAYANCSISLLSCTVSDETGNGIYLGSEALLSAYNSTINQCGGSAITTGPNGQVDLDYSLVVGNGGDGVEMGLGSNISVDNTLIGYNLGYGINTAGAAEIEYSVLRDNGKQGLKTAQFSTVDNSILWFNDGVPQMLTDNVFAVSYSNVQGINALLTSSSFAWGDGCIGTDPVFADDEAHLDPFSPCVDGGKPWEQDAHIPYGLGSSRADMGMYGGPANAFWGGQAPPDGAVVITDIFDIPDDQGGEVGLHFTASPFDFGGLGFNVTHYSIWRDLAVGSDLPTEVESGNWEQIGTVPAQGFNQYGYTATTLVDQTPDDDACLSSFLVIAHTTDDNIYWISDVASVCSIDNLAPDTPDMNGMVVEGSEGMPEAVISWAEVEVDDYFYTTVTNLATGFEATVYSDTLVVDASVEGGLSYDYSAVHVDIHGNVSDTAGLTLMVPGGEDFIPLHAGWNLVALDRHPGLLPIAELTSSLLPGNLKYITGFDNGAQFYEADGLPFLNTLVSLEGGRGYWFKVNQADTLQVAGPRVLESDLAPLEPGWNLVGYVSDDPVSPEAHFSTELVDGELLFVTGFTQEGVTIFNPNAPSFLNTLSELENSKGYWVKMAPGFEGMTTSSNPDFIVLNGSGAMSFEDIQVINESGDVVGVLNVLDGGFAMTSALYGVDPENGISRGIRHGESLRFKQGDKWAAETILFEGGMKHHHVNFHFETSPGVAEAYPNPARDFVSCLYHGEGMPSAWNILDAAGRVVATQAAEAAGMATTLDISWLEAGMYFAAPSGSTVMTAEPITFQVIR